MKETDNVEVADTYQLQRIADALEEILRLVKVDQAKTAERYKEYDKESEDPFIKTMEAGERE
jgi:hypothetical protein